VVPSEEVADVSGCCGVGVGSNWPIWRFESVLRGPRCSEVRPTVFFGVSQIANCPFPVRYRSSKPGSQPEAMDYSGLNSAERKLSAADTFAALAARNFALSQPWISGGDNRANARQHLFWSSAVMMTVYMDRARAIVIY
jgi:hypothetical protein